MFNINSIFYIMNNLFSKYYVKYIYKYCNITHNHFISVIYQHRPLKKIHIGQPLEICIITFLMLTILNYLQCMMRPAETEGGLESNLCSDQAIEPTVRTSSCNESIFSHIKTM